LPHIPLWTAILAGVLLSAGLERLFHKRGKFRYMGADGVEHEYDDISEFRSAVRSDTTVKGAADVETSPDDYIENRVMMSTLNKYVASRAFRGAEVEVVFGSANFYFDRTSMAENTTMLHTTVVFGTMNLYVPADWIVYDQASRYFSSKNEPAVNGVPGAPTLCIDGECVMGRINDELGLSGLSRSTAVLATNKHEMRLALERGGARNPLSILVADATSAWQIFHDIFKSEAIVKPSRNSGSRGIVKIDKSISLEEFRGVYERAYNESRDRQVLLEQFISGPEFSVEMIVWNGTIHVLAVTDKKTSGVPHFVELGHNQPSVFDPEVINAVKDEAVVGVKALGLNNCAIHAELKVDHNKAYIIEIGARLGGDFISTELVRLSTGIDMVRAAISVALGEEPDLAPHGKKQGVCIRYLCPKPGTVTAINGTDILSDPHIYDSGIYIKPGDVVKEVHSSLDRSGHLIVVDDTVEAAIERADLLLSQINVETI